jgi:methyl-accepting chemotaxis protein
MTNSTAPAKTRGKPPKGRSWGRSFLAPGTHLMFALPMKAKLALLAASMSIPMCWLMSMSLQAQWEQRQFAITELHGISHAELILPVMLEVQKHRGLNESLAQGDGAAKAQRDEARKALKKAVSALDEHLASGGPIELNDAWNPLRADLNTLADGGMPAGPGVPFEIHTRIIERTRQLALINAERSGLVLDPDARSYFLMDLITNTLPSAMESTSMVRDMGTGLLHIGQGGFSARSTVLGYSSRLVQGLSDAGSKLAAFERAGGRGLTAWPVARTALLAMDKQVHTEFENEAFQAKGSLFFDSVSKGVNHLHDLHNEAVVALKNEINLRKQDIERAMMLHTAVFLTGVLLLAYLGISFSATFQASMRVLRSGTDAMARGDLAHRTRVRGRDELAAIGLTVDATCNVLSSLVAEIRTSAELVNLAGTQVADGSQRLSERTDEQAHSLRTSVDAIGQLSLAVAQNAQAARELDTLTENLFDQAQQGHGAMAETVGAMTRMQEASQRVAEVVQVIDDVAFQTGMLSLNAAVEAARAGDAGKGFAVVASEVRQLARRCAESADEIRTLIGDASVQVDTSATKLQGVSQSLDVIVGGVREVSGRLRSISTASTQQSAGLGEVTESVGNLDKITRENAALVEMSASASSTLMERATALRGAVVSMRLRQASAEEAHDLVMTALQHIETVGREAAFADFHDPESPFIDRDLYIFVFDRAGVYGVCGAQPELVGTHRDSNLNLVTASFLTNCWAAADSGGGWVSYDIAPAGSKEVLAKESFIMPLGNNEIIGCGVYRREGSGTLRGAKPKAVAWDRAALT